MPRVAECVKEQEVAGISNAGRNPDAMRRISPTVVMAGSLKQEIEAVKMSSSGEEHMFKRILLLFVVASLIGTPVLAGGRPEFDAVGDDSANIFNDTAEQNIVANAVDAFLNLIEKFSDFTSFTTPFGFAEFFATQAGALYPDPCFYYLPGVHAPYLSALTATYDQGAYEWRIVLQMKPQTDINLKIINCVLKNGGTDVFSSADQTGFYRTPWGQLAFVQSANPSITVRAFPGPFATPGFLTPVIMDARTMPVLSPVALNNALYTSKALWSETIPLALPATGSSNTSGQSVFNLKQGDMIDVLITIPFNNTVDVRYGSDNVVLKYVGIIGTEYTNILSK